MNGARRTSSLSSRRIWSGASTRALIETRMATSYASDPPAVPSRLPREPQAPFQHVDERIAEAGRERRRWIGTRLGVLGPAPAPQVFEDVEVRPVRLAVGIEERVVGALQQLDV